MPVFGWFDTTETRRFANAVSEDLAGRIPPPTGNSRKTMTPERVRNAHEAMCSRAGAFARTHKLNWFKKAHLGSTFRDALLELGYDKAFVKSWTHDLLVAVSAIPTVKDFSG